MVPIICCAKSWMGKTSLNPFMQAEKKKKQNLRDCAVCQEYWFTENTSSFFSSWLLFHQHSYRRAILKTEPIDNHCCKTHLKSWWWTRKMEKRIKEWQRCRQHSSVKIYSLPILIYWGRMVKRVQKLSIHIHYQRRRRKKEFSLHFTWFQEWLGSVVSLKLLGKYSISVISVKGITHFHCSIFTQKRLELYLKNKIKQKQGRRQGFFLFLFCFELISI